jgi:hypothetical protein
MNKGGIMVNAEITVRFKIKNLCSEDDLEVAGSLKRAAEYFMEFKAFSVQLIGALREKTELVDMQIEEARRFEDSV